MNKSVFFFLFFKTLKFALCFQEGKNIAPKFCERAAKKTTKMAGKHFKRQNGEKVSGKLFRKRAFFAATFTLSLLFTFAPLWVRFSKKRLLFVT